MVTIIACWTHRPEAQLDSINHRCFRRIEVSSGSSMPQPQRACYPRTRQRLSNNGDSPRTLLSAYARDTLKVPLRPYSRSQGMYLLGATYMRRSSWILSGACYNHDFRSCSTCPLVFKTSLQPPRTSITIMPIMPLSMGIPNQVVQWYEQGHDIDFIGWLFLATLMLIWPWIFFGVVWQLDGLEMQHNAARIASRHTQDVAFFVTTISNGIGLLIGFLFGKAVSRLAQKWVVHKDSTVAHVSLLTNLKNRSLPTSLFFQRRLLSVFIVVFYMSVFALVPGGITALLTPVIFPRHTDINGTELDFGSTNVSCIDWFNNNIIPHTCDWTVGSSQISWNDSVLICHLFLFRFTRVQITQNVLKKIN